MLFLVVLGLIIFGFYVTTHSFGMVRLIGKADWAEKYLGPTGSYTMWKLAGIFCILAAIFILTHRNLFGL
jgi:hypothetical protein